MPIFRCVKCGAYDNTALTNFWRFRQENQPLCSECDPAIGRWHGEWPKASAEGWYVDRDGFIWSEIELPTINYTTMRARIVDGVEVPLTAEQRAALPAAVR